MELRFGPFTLRPAQRILLDGAQPLRLGSRAFDLLVMLVERAGEVVPNAELLAAVWHNRVVEEGSLRVHVAALRKALGEGHRGQRYIANVPLRGYCFVAAVEREGVDGSPTVAAPVGASATQAAASALPPPLTRMLGRDEALHELRRQLPLRRCITLVGVGGIGKTTLALALARGLSEEDGEAWEAHFVELAALGDPQLVPAAVASALGLVLPAAEPLVAMGNFLRARQRLLLVLDNCEHVVGAVAQLAEQLLLRAPGVSLLATSREALRIQGEWVQRLPSLPLPASDSSAAEALASPAVQLFAERAAAGSGSFQLRDEDAALVLDLCRRLDGIPLAIELAAAAIDQFGLQGLAEQLGAHLSVLSRGRRTALPRHQTLRATLDWSYALLSAPEQALLPRLALFRSAFTRAAAQALAGAGSDVDEALAGLVAKSMLVADIGGENVLYRLLETTRAYATERLARDGRAAELAARHVAWVLGLFRGAEGPGGTPPSADWLAAHVRHVDDVRAAVAWAFSPEGELSLGITLVARSAPLWFAQSLMDEYRRLAERALAAIETRPTTDPEDTMRLAEAYGHALWHTRGGGPAMAASFRRALAIAEELNATPYKLRCMWGLWLICNTTGDYAGSAAYAERFGVEVAGAADVATLLTHDRMMALGLHFHGEQARARTYAERVLEHPLTINHTARHSGFQFDQRVAALTVMARIGWVHGQPDRALTLARAAVDEALAIDHSLSLCYAIANGAAPVAFWAGEIELARHWTTLLQQRADERSLHFWQAFGGGYRLLLDLLEQGDDGPPRDALFRPGVAFLLRETLATVNPCLYDDALRERAMAGRSGWCLPEMLRLEAVRLVRVGAPAPEVSALLQRALAAADEQGALSWRLRCAISLAQLHAEAGEREVAGAVLDDTLSRFEGVSTTADHRTARTLLSVVRPAAVPDGLAPHHKV